MLRDILSIGDYKIKIQIKFEKCCRYSKSCFILYLIRNKKIHLINIFSFNNCNYIVLINGEIIIIDMFTKDLLQNKFIHDLRLKMMVFTIYLHNMGL